MYAGLWTKNGEQILPSFISINAKVVDLAAQIVFKKTYSEINKYFPATTSNDEATFKAFLNTSLGVLCGFEINLDGKKIKSKVISQQDAMKLFEKNQLANVVKEAEIGSSIASNQDPYIEEDIFLCKLNNLSQYNSLEIIITYATEISTQGDNFLMEFPTSLSTIRSSSFFENIDETTQGGKSNLASSNSSIPNSAKQGLFIELNLEMPSNISEITSPTHPKAITADYSKSNGKVTYKDTRSMEDVVNQIDLVILVKLENPHEPYGFIEQNSDGSRALMIAFYPQLVDTSSSSATTSPIATAIANAANVNALGGSATGQSNKEVEMIFLIDVSESMDSYNISHSKKALHMFLHSLSKDTYFNIISFGSKFTKLFDKSVKYDNDRLAAATQYVKNLKSDSGETNLLAPLQDIYSQRTTRPRKIFLLTDGRVSNVGPIVELVRQHADSTSVFPIGMGEYVSRQLVYLIANAGSGVAELAIENETIESKVMRQLKRALQPAMSNIRIDWGSLSNKNQAPRDLSTLFLGDRLTVYNILDKDQKIDGTVKLTANGPNGPVSFPVTIKQEETKQGNIVHNLAAYTLISDLQDQIEETSDPKVIDQIRQKIITLGIKYGLASYYTSFFSVEQTDEEEQKEKEQKEKEQLSQAQPQQPQQNGSAATNNLSSSTNTTPNQTPTKSNLLTPNDVSPQNMNKSSDKLYQKSPIQQNVESAMISLRGSASGIPTNTHYQQQQQPQQPQTPQQQPQHPITLTPTSAPFVPASLGSTPLRLSTPLSKLRLDSPEFVPKSFMTPNGTTTATTTPTTSIPFNIPQSPLKPSASTIVKQQQPVVESKPVVQTVSPSKTTTNNNATTAATVASTSPVVEKAKSVEPTPTPVANKPLTAAELIMQAASKPPVKPVVVEQTKPVVVEQTKPVVVEQPSTPVKPVVVEQTKPVVEQPVTPVKSVEQQQQQPTTPVVNKPMTAADIIAAAQQAQQQKPATPVKPVVVEQQQPTTPAKPVVVEQAKPVSTPVKPVVVEQAKPVVVEQSKPVVVEQQQTPVKESTTAASKIAAVVAQQQQTPVKSAEQPTTVETKQPQQPSTPVQKKQPINLNPSQNQHSTASIQNVLNNFNFQTKEKESVVATQNTAEQSSSSSTATTASSTVAPEKKPVVTNILNIPTTTSVASKRVYDYEKLLSLRFTPQSVPVPDQLRDSPIYKNNNAGSNKGHFGKKKGGKGQYGFNHGQQSSTPTTVPKKMYSKDTDGTHSELLKKFKFNLNRITMDTYSSLVKNIEELKTMITDEEALSGVCNILYEKAVIDQKYSAVYAILSGNLNKVYPKFDKINVRLCILNSCKTVFASEIDKSKLEGLNKEDTEEQEFFFKRRILGNLKFIGELYKQDELSAGIAKAITNQLVEKVQKTLTEESIESIVKLMSTLGKKLDETDKPAVEDYFKKISDLSENEGVSSRGRYLLLGLLDLRTNKWQLKNQVKQVKEESEKEERFIAKHGGKGGRGGDDLRRSSDSRTPPRGKGLFSGDSRDNSGRGDNNSRDYDNRRDNKNKDGWETVGKPSKGGRGGKTPTKGGKGGNDSSFGPSSSSPFGKGGRGGNSPQMQGQNSSFGPSNNNSGNNNSNNKKDEFSSNSRNNMFNALRMDDEYTPSSPNQNNNRNNNNRNNNNNNRDQNRDRNIDREEKQPIQEEIKAVVKQSSTEEDLEKINDTIGITLDEYLETLDIDEAIECIKELDYPHLLGKIFGTIVSTSFEKKEKEKTQILELLKGVFEALLFNTENVKEGLKDIIESIEDIEVDLPFASKFLANVVGTCIEQEVLNLNYLEESYVYLADTGKAEEMLIDTFKAIVAQSDSDRLQDLYEKAENLDILELFRFKNRNITYLNEFFDSHFPYLSASAPEKLQKSSPISESEIIEHLLMEQSADGYWVISKKLANILNVPFSDITKAESSESIQISHPNIWATCLAYSYIQIKCLEEKEELEIVLQKTGNWLDSEFALTSSPNESLNEILMKAKRLISEYD